MVKVVTIAQARRILGPLASPMADDQVQELILSLHLLARERKVYNGSKEEENGNVQQLNCTKRSSRICSNIKPKTTKR